MTSTEVTKDTPSTMEKDILPPPPAAALSSASKRTELMRIADSLEVEDEYQIGFQRDHPIGQHRYALLRSNQIFDRLVTLYTRQFNAHWPIFKRTAEAHPLPPGYLNHMSYAASCYISAWFWDLYVSNRNSVMKVSLTAFTQHYTTQQCFAFERYDPFLKHLNSVIRPVHISFALEDMIYIPLISVNINWNNASPFGIPNFIMNKDLVHGLLDNMDQKINNWSVEPLGHETLGRPMWLLDWKLNQAYAWFPQESNFSKEDLIAAHILGIPCTPRLGPRDLDDWQFFPGGIAPANINVNNYHRLTDRNFYGAAEYRTLTIDTNYIFIDPTQNAQAGQKRKAPSQPQQKDAVTNANLALAEPSSSQAMEQDQPIPVLARYRIIDWTYHGRVILNLNHQKQNQALRSFLFKN